MESNFLSGARGGVALAVGANDDLIRVAMQTSSQYRPIAQEGALRFRPSGSSTTA